MTIEAGIVDESVALAAEILNRLGRPGAGARLRDEHACDGDGRCRGCPHAGTVAPWFPCRLRLIGQAAADLGTRRAVPREGGIG